MKKFISILLSICLGLFLADALISLADDSLVLFFGVHPISLLRGIVGFVVLLMSLLIYCLTGLTPMIPKRLFLPVTLFNPAAALVLIFFSIYWFSRIQAFYWIA